MAEPKPGTQAERCETEKAPVQVAVRAVAVPHSRATTATPPVWSIRWSGICTD